MKGSSPAVSDTVPDMARYDTDDDSRRASAAAALLLPVLLPVLAVVVVAFMLVLLLLAMVAAVRVSSVETVEPTALAVALLMPTSFEEAAIEPTRSRAVLRPYIIGKREHRAGRQM